jgi:hypothetical protein
MIYPAWWEVLLSLIWSEKNRVIGFVKSIIIGYRKEKLVAIVAKEGKYINDQTGQIYDPKEWIINEWGKITVVKRLSDAQLAFIESLEYQLGYKPKNHSNMPAHKAVKTIVRLKELIAKKHKDQETLF